MIFSYIFTDKDIHDNCVVVYTAVRKELARRSQAASEEWKVQMHEAEKTLDEHASSQLSVNAGMCY